VIISKGRLENISRSTEVSAVGDIDSTPIGSFVRVRRLETPRLLLNGTAQSAIGTR
jgi:hypothetical protein